MLQQAISRDGSMRLPTKSSAWTGRFTEGEGSSSSVSCAASNVVANIDDALLGSADARKLDEYAATAGGYPRPGLLRRKDTETTIHGPVGLFEQTGCPRGHKLQRYKGLGEMNAGQPLGNHARHQRAHAF